MIWALTWQHIHPSIATLLTLVGLGVLMMPITLGLLFQEALLYPGLAWLLILREPKSHCSLHVTQLSPCPFQHYTYCLYPPPPPGGMTLNPCHIYPIPAPTLTCRWVRDDEGRDTAAWGWTSCCTAHIRRCCRGRSEVQCWSSARSTLLVAH